MVQGTMQGLWGKVEVSEEGTVRAWHPLGHHCLDVACCVEALLQESTLGRRLAVLGGRSELQAIDIARLCVLAFLHDYGKVNHGFQRKWNPRATQTAGHTSEAVMLIKPTLGAAFLALRKRAIEALQLRSLMPWCANDENTLLSLLFASVSHHGKPLHFETATALGTPRPEIWEARDGIDPIHEIGSLVSLAQQCFPQAWQDSDSPPLPTQPAFQHAFAGLVSLADWIGSDTAFFPYSKDIDEDRLTFARSRAREAIHAIGTSTSLWRVALGAAEVSFAQLMGAPHFRPRGMQSKVTSLDVTSSGSVSILEAETGAGKTEAALLRFFQLFQAKEVDGMYFALPTRTSAVQLHRRVVDAARHVFGHDAPPVVLAVPGYLSVDDREGKRLPHFNVLWNDVPSDRFRYRGWAAEHPKRYLAGSIVVGTIDQVLLSTLATGHAHMRATSLLRQFLVVDEVHASDAYMNRLLENVLRTHVLAGGHAFLMSATLGSSERARLLAVTKQSKRPVPDLSFEEACHVPYPQLTHATVGRNELVSLTTQEASLPKRVTVSLDATVDNPEHVAGQALEAASAGAYVIIIRNTVADCLATQVALEALAEAHQAHACLFRCHDVAAPHHARFAREDRIKLDAALEVTFGKDSRPGGHVEGASGCVVVATQTVQQSLDLDADWMITDLCPMDVLLQRVGRLHRHRRAARPEGYATPKASVLVGREDFASYIKNDGSGTGPHGWGTVYENLMILDATKTALAEHTTLSIPEQNRWLVERCTHPPTLKAHIDKAQNDKVQNDRWQSHWRWCWGSKLAEHRLADTSLVNWQETFKECDAPFHAKDRKLSTRLGESDRMVEWKPSLQSPFGENIHQLSMSAALSRGLSEEISPSIAPKPEQDGFSFVLEGIRFSYSRHGLEREQTK